MGQLVRTRRLATEWSLHEPPLPVSTHAIWWEVVCEACGDDLGPAADQSPAVRALRGPYATIGAAAMAAARHEKVHERREDRGTPAT